MKKICVVILLAIFTSVYSTMVYASTSKESLYRATGYYPFTCTKSERAVEGGTKDRYGNRLRTLQEYEEGSYVSIATDPKVIKSGTVLAIKEFPNVKFLACDVGKAIKGKKIDICVKYRNDAYALPSKITVKKVTDTDGENRNIIKFWKQIFTAFNNEIQKLERHYFNPKNNTRLCMVWGNSIPSESTMVNSRIGCGEERIQRFCHR